MGPIEDSVVNDQELGPYRIVSKLGAGGMGDVWLATEISLGRKIALKPRTSTCFDSGSTRRLGVLSARRCS